MNRRTSPGVSAADIAAAAEKAEAASNTAAAGAAGVSASNSENPIGLYKGF